MISQPNPTGDLVQDLLENLGDVESSIGVLRALGFQRPEQAFDNLKVIFGRPHRPGDLALCGDFLRRWLAASYDPDRSLNNLERLFERSDSGQELLGWMTQHPHMVSSLSALFSGSQHLTDVLLRDRALLAALEDPACIDAPTSHEAITRALKAELVGSRTERERFARVRRFKRLRDVRIVVRDLTGIAHTEETIRELSMVADVCIQQIYEICLEQMIHRYGQPFYRGEGGRRTPAEFTVLGLGKLGGEELNFSSDIDLMYLYSSDEGRTEGVAQPRGGPKGVISLHEFFTRLAKAITAALSDITEEGNIFRVDLRLRPEGKSGDIAYSLRSYEIYYESWGETWERQALIKTRVVAGSRALGEVFLQTVRPFVYRKYLDYGALEEIRGIKERINRSRRFARDGEEDVKLGRGGIREIEFVIQALQLIFGGKNPSLQERNTLRALDRLRDAGHLDPEDHRQLHEAYLFLRNLENRIQMAHGLQQYALPREPAERLALARKMGFRHGDAIDRLLADYARHTEAVARIYGNLFREAGEERDDEAWQIDLEDREAAARGLESMGFEDPRRTYDNLILLRDGPLFVHPTAKSKRLFYAMLPHLLQTSVSLPHPDMAVNNLERFLTQSRAREILLSILLEEEKFNELLLTLFGTSQFLSNILLSQPLLIDALMNPAALLQRRAPNEMESTLTERLDGGNRQHAANALRGWKQAEELRIGLNFLLGQTTLAETMEDLTHLADISLRSALALAEEELYRESEEEPCGGEARGPQAPRTALMGLGKLGGGELNFGSDLDLLLLYDVNEEKPAPTDSHTEQRLLVAPHVYSTKLYAKLIDLVSGVTEAGQLYKIDMRIRPEGEKGPIAVSLSALTHYLDEKMETWERQALTRIRWIAGDERLGRRAIDEVHRRVYQASDPTLLAGEIDYMRRRMEVELSQEQEGLKNLKVGYGGLVDVEFTVQYLQLCHGHQFPSIRHPNTLRALGAARDAGLLDAETSDQLAEHYLFLRELETRLRIVSNRRHQFLTTDEREVARLARSMGYRATAFTREAENLLSAYKAHTERVRSIYQRVFRPAE